MQDSVFDPDTFAATSFEGGFETAVTIPPEGDYPAVIDNAKAKNPKDNVYVLEVYWQLQDHELAERLNLGFGDDGVQRLPIVRQSMFLDVENGTLQSGKNRNINLGRLLDAVGMNAKGQKWSTDSLAGLRAVVQVKHEADRNDPSIQYARVVRVAKAR